jgi:hypothetical protein
MLGGIVLVSPVAADIRQAFSDGPAVPTKGASVPLSAPLPTLSSAQHDIARLAVRTDAKLAAILGSNQAYEIARIGPWTTVKNPSLLGAVVEIELSRPLATTANFPLLAYDESEQSSPPYRINVRALRVESAPTLSLLVEFGSNTVIAIRPVGDSVYTSVNAVPPTTEGD